MAEAIALRYIDIDWIDLEIAFRDSATGISSYLDLESGEVVDYVDTSDITYRLIKKYPDRFAKIPVFSTREGIEVLCSFIDQLPPSNLRAKLRRAAKGPGVLTRCLNVLAQSAHLFDRFTRFEEQAIGERLTLWLASMGLQSSQLPPFTPTLHLISG